MVSPRMCQQTHSQYAGFGRSHQPEVYGYACGCACGDPFIAEVMSFFMENGNSVHLDGLGSFYYKLSCAGNGVDTPEEVSREQVKAVRVQFIPERRKKCGKYCRALGEGVELVKLGD